MPFLYIPGSEWAVLRDEIYDVRSRLARIEGDTRRLLRAANLEVERDYMAQQDIDNLRAKVEANGTVINSAVSLIQGLAQQVRDNADDPAELQALAGQLESSANALAQAVTANTPAA
jgi:hypothetical protein